MSDSGDDWENQLDSDNEQEVEKKKAEEEAKKKTFGEEDTVDTEKLKAEKLEAQKKLDREAQENGRVKSTKAVDYDKIFRERQAKLAGTPIEAIEESKTQGMSQAAKGLLMEQAQEKNLVDQLFAGDVDSGNKPPTVILASEKDYKQLGSKVAEALYAGSAPYRIEAFFKEISKDLPQHADSKQIEKIHQHFKTMFNQKQKDEKSAAKTKSSKPSLKGSNKASDRNNNAAMINDVMGNADGEEDYEDYGAEGFKRENEADYDFM